MQRESPFVPSLIAHSIIDWVGLYGGNPRCRLRLSSAWADSLARRKDAPTGASDEPRKDLTGG